MVIHVHGESIISITEYYCIEEEEITELGPLDGYLIEGETRCEMVDYWRVFYGMFINGEVAIDADGLFKWEF